MKVKDIMTTNVITVTPETKLKEVAKIIKGHRINGLPVLNEAREVVGIITITDLLRLLRDIHYWERVEKENPEVRIIKDILVKEKNESTVNMKMTKMIWTVDEDSELDDVLELMYKYDIHTIPVTKDHKLVGIIGATDIVNSCI